MTHHPMERHAKLITTLVYLWYYYKCYILLSEFKTFTFLVGAISSNFTCTLQQQQPHSNFESWVPYHCGSHVYIPERWVVLMSQHQKDCWLELEYLSRQIVQPNGARSLRNPTAWTGSMQNGLLSHEAVCLTCFLNAESCMSAVLIVKCKGNLFITLHKCYLSTS